MVKYIQELSEPDHSTDDQSQPPLEERLGATMDFIIGLASNPDASPGRDPVTEAAGQIEALTRLSNSGAITAEKFRDAVNRINSRLSEAQQQDLQRRLQLKIFALDNLTELETAASRPADPSPPSPTPDSVLKTRDSSVPSPTPDFRLKTRDSRLLPGLERYILPTDYVTSSPGPWPPTSPNLSVVEPRPTNPAYLSPSEEDSEDSQSLPMSFSIPYPGPLTSQAVTTRHLEEDSENSQSLPMSFSNRPRSNTPRCEPQPLEIDQQPMPPNLSVPTVRDRKGG
jgi:hypothetical protein